MIKNRTIYFNDARHYYLFVFEPPMSMEDAWRPIDEVAGTSIDTFIYGVARGDGLFYPSKVGLPFGTDTHPFDSAAYYRVFYNMQSLIERGLDPLQVLIDRAHSKGMEFFPSLRMSDTPGLNQDFHVNQGGRGHMHKETRDHQFNVIKELLYDYNSDGIELDFAAAPGGTDYWFNEQDAKENAHVMTDWVTEVSEMARSRKSSKPSIGARIYPTEQMNTDQGLEIKKWVEKGLIDWVVLLSYTDFKLDPDMPMEWIIDLCHANDISVYGMLQPYSIDESAGAPERVHAKPEVTRAAASYFYSKGVDGLYTWFLRWPLSNPERQTLTEIGDHDLVKMEDKNYVLRHKTEASEARGYGANIPIEIPSADPTKKYRIPFYVSDEFIEKASYIKQVKLRLNIANLLSDDKLTIELNGESLKNEPITRNYGRPFDPYGAQLLEFDLRNIKPKTGNNELSISLDARPEDMASGITVEKVELSVGYGSYPSTL